MSNNMMIKKWLILKVWEQYAGCKHSYLLQLKAEMNEDLRNLIFLDEDLAYEYYSQITFNLTEAEWNEIIKWWKGVKK